jgi:hypothetical protein
MALDCNRFTSSNAMKSMIATMGSLALVALLGCGASSAQQAPPAAAEAVAPPPPPPPPSAPPPEAETPASAPPAAPSAASSQPLPALPSSTPQYQAPAPSGDAPSTAAPPPGEVAPPAAQWVYSYPTGQWVYASGYGWVWVPAGSAPTAVEGVPYVYLYTPAYGWTWYVSPWGWGPYRYGVWVRHPFAPRGWHRTWVARPHVVVHLGGHGRRR